MRYGHSCISNRSCGAQVKVLLAEVLMLVSCTGTQTSEHDVAVWGAQAGPLPSTVAANSRLPGEAGAHGEVDNPKRVHGSGFGRSQASEER